MNTPGTRKQHHNMSAPMILFQDTYCHVLNNETGEIELIEGPKRFILPATKTLIGDKRAKLVVKEGQYVEVLNPYNPETKQCVMGQIEIRRGPLILSLYPFERCEGLVKDAVLLGKNQYLFVKATEGDDAGVLHRVKGPALHFPNPNEEIVGTFDAINIGENEAVYIQNTDTSELKLVKGPTSYMLEVNEKEYNKELSAEECSAIDASSATSSRAYSINIQKNEIVAITDYRSNKEKYILGPVCHILEPHEGVRVVKISGGIPKVENAISIAKVNLGPDFMIDSFEVRTKDNAVLNMVISYKWKFLILNDDELYKVFHGDFIGYSCQSMRSRIREQASTHDFESFHTSSSTILRSALFKDYEFTNKNNNSKQVHYGRFFSEFNFLVFSLDVKQVKPVDSELALLLDESIKSSMKIMCKKLNDSAEFAAEKERIENETEVAKLRKSLIEIEIGNYKKEVIEKARIEGSRLLEEATAEASASGHQKRNKLKLELENMKNVIDMLQGPDGDVYIEYAKVKNLGRNVQSATFVPSDVKTLIIPPTTSQLSADLY
ncbi:major vault protein [Acrasis kona]|uniref:Major vault protein n=1 Tax=Acrasis kona TaxID=1008807 RepID=A0AAW2Z646_9EUKA